MKTFLNLTFIRFEKLGNYYMIIPHIPIFFHRFTSSITHELSIITNRLNALQGNFHTLKMVPKNLIILSRNIISNVNTIL